MILSILQHKENLYIFSLKNYEYLEGDIFELIFAPDILEGTGDPFSEYTPADLDFKKCNVGLEEGCEIKTELNKIFIHNFISLKGIELNICIHICMYTYMTCIHI